MMKVAVLGGGTGMSCLLRGLKKLPFDISAIVSVCDDGSSTGRLREEFHTPAVGDIRKVLISLSENEDDIKKLFDYRFNTSSDLDGHALGNLLLTGAATITGNVSDGIELVNSLLKLKGKVIPLTEDNVNLVGITEDNEKIVGEEQLTKCAKKIIKVKYDKKFTINPKVIKAVEEADLIIFSTGSLLTSILPHLIDKTLVRCINKSKANKMYVCNLFTQPGETDNFKVSDHIKELEKYLGKNSIDVVIANDKIMNSELALKYSNEEQKDPIILDEDEIEKMHVKLIKSKLYKIENGVYRHDSLKTAYLIFSYLMDNE